MQVSDVALSCLSGSVVGNALGLGAQRLVGKPHPCPKLPNVKNSHHSELQFPALKTSGVTKILLTDLREVIWL